MLDVNVSAISYLMWSGFKRHMYFTIKYIRLMWLKVLRSKEMAAGSCSTTPTTNYLILTFVYFFSLQMSSLPPSSSSSDQSSVNEMQFYLLLNCFNREKRRRRSDPKISSIKFCLPLSNFFQAFFPCWDVRA